MSDYTRSREEFCAALAREFPEESIGRIREKMDRIVRAACAVQYHALLACNGETSPAQDAKAERAEERIRAEFGPGYSFEFSGDPRGACSKVALKRTVGNSWGDRSLYCIPTRRY